jgi:tRNA A37 N6-isopentenylltransferase MiaA
MGTLEHTHDIIDSFYNEYPTGVVVIWGATATGKTGLSIRLADHFPLEVISADSRQIFRYMDIATDKI